LEIWLQTGKRASDVYAYQKSDPNNVTHEMTDTKAQIPQLRFDPLVFWAFASADTLMQRLDARVIAMVRSGLIEEVNNLSRLRSQLEEGGNEVDLSRGIWGSIGYKQFLTYHNALRAGGPPAELQELEKEAIERTQIATRQYSKKQLRWIQIKFVSAMMRSCVSKRLFLLDGSDLSQWNGKVCTTALDLTRIFLDGDSLPDPIHLAGSLKEELNPRGQDLSHNPDLWQRRTCEVCSVTATTENDWQKHIEGNRHKKKQRRHRANRSMGDIHGRQSAKPLIAE